MSASARLRRAVAPLALRYYQWRRDPLALLFRPEAKDDPYPHYASIRRSGLVVSPLGPLATASYETAASVLRDRRFSASPTHLPDYTPPSYPPGDERAELLGPETSLLTMDPPDHTRIRRLVAGTFTPRAIAGLEPFVRETTDRLLADIAPGAPFDVIGALAFPLPIAVISHLLGVPEEDREQFRRWGHDVAATLEPRLDKEPDPGVAASEVALTRYLRDLVASRRQAPDDSLLSRLVAAEEEGERLSSDELVATALLVLVAGFETTVNLIGNGTKALMEAPGQWELLRSDPALAPAAVEELLRFDSPVQLTSRTATEELELEGRTVPLGKNVVVAIGGANRDPAAFESPDRLDIARSDAQRHLSFSLGIHHCLGAALARLEGRVAFEALSSRFTGLQPAAEPVRRPFLILRGFEHLPVRPLETRVRT